VAGVPGVPAGAEQAGLGGRKQPELRSVGLAQDDETRALVPGHQLTVVVGHEVPEEARPRRQRHTGVGSEYVLEQKRHAGEWPVRQVALGGCAALVIYRRNHRVHRVQLGVQALDPRYGRVNQLYRLDLAPLHEIGLCRGIKGGKLILTWHVSPSV